MAWKNTKQLSLADALAIQHKAITALDDVHALIDWERIQGMLASIHANKNTGHRSFFLLLSLPLKFC